MIKAFQKKILVWLSTLRNEGFLEFFIMLLRYIQKHTQKRSTSTTSTKNRIHTKAKYSEILNFEPDKLRKFSTTKSSGPYTFGWIMPPPGKGSGGHLNIFRFIEYLERSGHTCNIYLYVDGAKSTIQAIRAIMGDSYPAIKAAETMQWLDPGDPMDDIDAVFCTSWETAYTSYSLSTDCKRFYFVQDFEPYFYPVGGMYSLAENTYKMGFHGITAGGWLEKKLHEEYGMLTDSFDFGADLKTYNLTNTTKRKEILYYARPYTERRGFEVGILALDLFHSMHPDYTINIVGWDVSNYDIAFPYKNLKTLEVSQLNDLYNRCVAGLVLSYTNMSLLPLELLGCGTIPVVNEGKNNQLVSDNPFIAYSSNDPHSLAAKLSEVVTRKSRLKYAEEASASVKQHGWAASGAKFVNIIEREMKK